MGRDYVVREIMELEEKLKISRALLERARSDYRMKWFTAYGSKEDCIAYGANMAREVIRLERRLAELWAKIPREVDTDY